MNSTVDVRRGSPIRTAAHHATLSVPRCGPDDEVGAVLAAMTGTRFVSAAVVAVCVADRLVGLVTVERLLAAAAAAVVRDIMDPDPPVVTASTGQERAAWAAVDRAEPGLAVVDDDGRFVGLVPPHRLLGVLLAEHDEDLARLSGFLGTASAARAASGERVARRLWHRLPWLLVGLAGAMVAAAVVGSFEQVLRRNLLVAFFVPAVVYLAAAVGMQTETLVVRGLSLGVPVGRVVVRESVTGLLIGGLLAAVAGPLVWLVWGDARVAAAMGVALLAACAVATVVAMALPWLFSRFGLDPVFGSGPLATVAQDVLSILIYLSSATLLIDTGEAP